MSAETLRRAAALMRERAEAATPGPWAMWNGWGPLASDGLMRCERLGSADQAAIQPSGDSPDIAGRREDFEHIATFADPAVALAVADLLDALAVDREVDPYLGKPFDEPALRFARAYLGESS